MNFGCLLLGLQIALLAAAAVAARAMGVEMRPLQSLVRLSRDRLRGSFPSPCLAVRRQQILRRYMHASSQDADPVQTALTKENAVQAAKLAFPSPPSIILVNPFLDQNVGSVARAMLNFGLTDLRIVDPVCDIYNEKVRALAVGAFPIVENASIYPTVAACVADLQQVIATTVRPRRMTHTVLTPRQAAEQAISFNGKVGILFGRERTGLLNEEIAVADTIITIDSLAAFSSLNLAQSVNLVAYELWNANQALRSLSSFEAIASRRSTGALASQECLDHFYQTLESSLDECSYSRKNFSNRHPYQTLRSVFHRCKLTTSEVDMLHGVVKTLLRGPAQDSAKKD